MAKLKKSEFPVKFKVGDKVRVRHGFMDVDYPDMPMGGWAGTVTDVDGTDSFTVRWSKETLKAIHPVFLKRCEIDGLDSEEYVLTGDDLVPDTGGPLDIEQPTKITTKPLSPKDQDDRIRMIFALTSNGAEYGHPERVRVIGLGDPDEEPMIDDEYGILCEARFEGQVVTVPLGELDNVKGKPNRQLVDDYCYWFHNWS
jgi:hypothetical protein